MILPEHHQEDECQPMKLVCWTLSCWYSGILTPFLNGCWGLCYLSMKKSSHCFPLLYYLLTLTPTICSWNDEVLKCKRSKQELNTKLSVSIKIEGTMKMVICCFCFTSQHYWWPLLSQSLLVVVAAVVWLLCCLQ